VNGYLCCCRYSCGAVTNILMIHFLVGTSAVPFEGGAVLYWCILLLHSVVHSAAVVLSVDAC